MYVSITLFHACEQLSFGSAVDLQLWVHMSAAFAQLTVELQFWQEKQLTAEPQFQALASCIHKCIHT
jgi:hypothetical protein